jgi:hypothetical protein
MDRRLAEIFCHVADFANRLGGCHYRERMTSAKRCPFSVAAFPAINICSSRCRAARSARSGSPLLTLSVENDAPSLTSRPSSTRDHIHSMWLRPSGSRLSGISLIGSQPFSDGSSSFAGCRPHCHLSEASGCTIRAAAISDHARLASKAPGPIRAV